MGIPRLLSTPKAAAPQPTVRRESYSLERTMQRVFNTPLMIHRGKLDAIMRVLGPRMGVSPNMYTDVPDEFMVERREDPQKDNGPVAVIPVYGSLVKRGDWMNSMSGLTSYDSLRAATQAALDDNTVKSLLFDIDSPGGEAAGLFDFVNWLSGVSGSKPFIGISNDMAFSAAYAIASAMDQLFVTSVGGVGSVGVVMLHVDQSGFDKQNGLTYTYITSGDKKAQGNPHEPLDKATKTEWQAEVDNIRDMFVSMVAENRGVDSKAVYDTEAGIFMGSAGVPMLADAVASYDEALAYAGDSAKAKRTVAMPGAPPEPKGSAEFGRDPFTRRGSVHVVHSQEEALRHLLRLSNEPDGHTPEVAVGSRWMAMRNQPGILLKPEQSAHGQISGVLAPYDRLSCDLGGFKEVYQAGCFKASLETADPLVLAYHDPSKVLGRKSAGTARFWEEEDGLHYEADLPDTQDARDLKESVKRGDVRGASAAFFIEKYRWETRGGDRVRVIEQAELVEGSPHSFTAYNDTTADTGQVDAAAQDELIGVRLRLLGQ